MRMLRRASMKSLQLMLVKHKLHIRQLSGIELALDQQQQPIQLRAMQRVGIQPGRTAAPEDLASLTTEVVGGER